MSFRIFTIKSKKICEQMYVFVLPINLVMWSGLLSPKGKQY